MRTRLSPSALRVAALLAAAGLCACVSSTAPDAPAPASLVLAVSGVGAHPGSLSGEVNLTARVRDAAGRPVQGALVQFGADRGALQVLSNSTDSFGIASARLGTIGSAGGRVVIATARTGPLSAKAQVRLGAPYAAL